MTVKTIRPMGKFAALTLVGALVGGVAVILPGLSVPSWASHLRGGLVTAEYHPAEEGHTEEVHLSATMLATLANPANFGSVSVYRENSGSWVEVTSDCNISQSNSTDTSSNPLFSINESTYTIQDCFDNSGLYLFQATRGARIGGIDNAASSSTVQFEAVLSIDGETETSAPTYSSGYMYNIAYASDLDYSTNLNALGQGNTSVTYELITSTTSGIGGYGASQIPCSNLNTSTGVFSINESNCSGSDTISGAFGAGELYALKVKATDSVGQYSTRDVLLQFGTTSNNAPVFSSYSPSPGTLSVTPGTTQTITVSATDADADVVDFTENLSKSWITESGVTTSGSGADTVYTKTYTLSPGSGVSETVQFEISAFDNDTFSLSTSIQYDIEAGGVLPPGTPGTPTLTAGPASLVATFTAPNSGGTVASYRADATPTAGGSAIQTNCGAPPGSPCTLSSLSPLVEYSVVIVAINSSGSASSSAAVETTLAQAASSDSGGDDRRDRRTRTQSPQLPPSPDPARVVAPPPGTPEVERPRIRQGPVLLNGVAPSQVRAPEFRVDGRSAPVETEITDPSTLSMRAGVVSLGVRVQQDEGSVSQLDDGATEISVRKGAKANLSGQGFRPESTVQVFLPLQGGNAKELTRIPVGPDGSFSGDAVFATQPDEDPLPVGRQVLQLVSIDQDGNEAVVDMTVNIAQPPPAPELNRVEGVIPTMTPGSSIATNAGVPEEVRVSAVQEQKLAVVEGDGWSMAIGVAAEDGGVQATEGGASLTLVRNESARVSGDGFMPGTRADVWLFSEPTLLGTVTIDDEGRFNGEVNIDGRLIAVGDHTLQLQGVGEDGYVRAANMGVTVGDPAEVVPTAEENSLMFIWSVLAALVLIALVIVFWIAANRRRQA